MSEDILLAWIGDALQDVAPEIEIDEIDADEDLREECDLDSMDFLNFLAALKTRSSVSIPEADYPKIDTLNHLLEYLAEHRQG